ncbi:MAG TPA: hypothetical protein VGG94_08670, partial [Chthoniobacterales bacterium]
MVAGVLLLLCTPLIVANGVRLWIWWQARQQHLTCTIEKIDAPFLGPVELRQIHLTGKGATLIDLTVARVRLTLNLRSILLRTRERAIQSLSAQDVRGEIHRQESGDSLSQGGWSTLQKSLPENFDIAPLNLRLEDGATVIILREVSLSGSEIENGTFEARELVISSPWFRQSFAGLRGSTNWQGDRLTIAGLSLARGLDIQSITADFSRLSQESIGLEFDADAFGGKIRANVSNEWSARPSNWNLAGSATDVSLEQTSQSLGFTDQVTGMLHACKFTFRGALNDPTHATASLWTELTALSWRHRAADVIMLGAALYNRQVQLQQLYVKQGNNQLTLNGEAGFPAKDFDWFNPDFRGNISASISNLGAFASLFGANAGDFAGEVAVEGTMSAGNRKIGGHVTAEGKALSVLKRPVDTFSAKLNLTATAFEIEQLELHQKNDFLRGQGKMDLAKDHAYSATASFAAEKVADYLPLLPAAWRNVVTAGGISCDWSGTGNVGSHAGMFTLHGHGLRVSHPADLVPFSAELQADYGPGKAFFRQVHLANEHASLNGFVTVAEKYFQLQAIALDVNGKPNLRGNAFIPLSLAKVAAGARLLDALDPAQKADIDMSLDPTDVAELSRALIGRNDFTGTFSTRISFFGGVDALQGWADLHMHDLAAANDAARLSTDAEIRFSAGTMNTKASVQFTGSSPLTLESSVPVRLVDQDKTALTEALSASVNFPAIFLSRLPRYLSRDAFRDGILSGTLVFAGSLRHPTIMGDVQLTNGNLGLTPLHFSEMSGRLAFKGETASLDFLNLGNQDVSLSLRGDLRFADLNAIDLELTANQAIIDQAPRPAGDCINEIKIDPLPAGEPVIGNIDRMTFQGGLLGKPWTVALTDHRLPSATAPAGPAA